MRTERAVDTMAGMTPAIAAMHTGGAQVAFNAQLPLVSMRIGERIEFPLKRRQSRGSSPTRSDSTLGGKTVRCVGEHHFHTGGQSCGSCVPVAVMRAAWRRELEGGRSFDGFFHFAWLDQVWLGYGLADGGVCGVYCPAHRAQREERLGYDPELGNSTTEL